MLVVVVVVVRASRVVVWEGGGGFQGGNNSDGLTSVGSVGLNYRKDYGKKVSSYGNYSFSNRDNDVISDQLQQNNFQNSLISTNQNSLKNLINNNHRFGWNIEYRPDSVNYIKFNPTFSYGSSWITEIQVIYNMIMLD
jgi:hypothetical protein